MATMTYEEFLTALRATPREWWFLSKRGTIRARVPGKGDLCCPITAVHPEHVCSVFAWEAARDLGLPGRIRERIVRAADYRSARDASAMRSELLMACGLED